jgi:hypothetical protein
MASGQGESCYLCSCCGTDIGSIRMYKHQFSVWGLGENASRIDWMRVAVLLRDREAAGKTGPFRIQIGNKKLAREDYCRFLEHYGASEADFLDIAIAFHNRASGEAGNGINRVLVTDAP